LKRLLKSMSTEHHNMAETGEQPPTNADVAFESSDIDARTILEYLFYLALAVVAAFIASVFIFRFTSKMAAVSDTPMAPVHRGVGPTMPPEPMLQGVPGHETDPQLDLRLKQAADQAANEKYDWTDKPAGIARIPVEEAMKIIVSKGLPAWPGPAAEKKK
jgi:hypothetical protein